MQKLKDFVLNKSEGRFYAGISAVLGISTGIVLGVVFKARIYKLISRLGLSPSGVMQKVNRPTSGAQYTKELPRGKHPIQLYSMATPNGVKVTMALELMGLKYDAYLINIMKGDQFGSGFVEINPNSKIPAMVDYSSGQPVHIFESGSILLYLAEKTGKFLPKDPAKKVECLNWLFFQMGAAPYIGNFGHFNNYAPKSLWYDHQYSRNRFLMETQRLCDVLDKKLGKSTFLIGEELTIADMAWFPWIICIDQGYKAYDIIGLDKYKNLQRWVDQIMKIEGVEKATFINSFWKNEGKLQEYHSE